MADTVNYDSYKESGHHAASGIPAIQEQASKIPSSNEALREQAVKQYADTYKALDDSYAKQLSAIISSQGNDEKLLMEQYNNSISSMAAQLQKRGLHLSTPLVGAQNAALNKHMNETTSMRQQIYSAQRSLPTRNREHLHSDYENAIAQRVAVNRATYVPVLSDVLASIAELQSASFVDYLDFILAKKNLENKSSGGGSSKKSSSSSSTSKKTSSSGKVNLPSYDGSKGQMIGNYGAGGWSHFYTSMK